MKIFISWSGKRSKTIAKSLRDWIITFYEKKYVEPWMSDKDIGPGTIWTIEMKKALKESKMALLCITPENVLAPWIIYEAGAISNSIAKSLIIPYLVDVEIPDISAPLRQFQSVIADKDGTKRIIKTINNGIGNALEDNELENRFQKQWPYLKIVIEKPQSGCLYLADDHDIWEVAERMVKNIPKGGSVYDTTSINNKPEYESQIEKSVLQGVNVTRIIATDACSHSLEMYIRPPSLYQGDKKNVQRNLRIFHYPFPNPIDILITKHGVNKESILGFRSSQSLHHNPQYKSGLYVASKEMVEDIINTYEKFLESKSHNFHQQEAPSKSCNICREILKELHYD